MSVAPFKKGIYETEYGNAAYWDTGKLFDDIMTIAKSNHVS